MGAMTFLWTSAGEGQEEASPVARAGGGGSLVRKLPNSSLGHLQLQSETYLFTAVLVNGICPLELHSV